MSIHTLLFYIIASLILEVILKELSKKKKTSFIDDILISNIYLIILAGFFSVYHLTENNQTIFLIILFQILEDIFYTSVIKEISLFKNNTYFLKKYILTFFSAYVINTFFINQIESTFLKIEEVKLLLWIFILIYLSSYLKKNFSLSLSQNKQLPFDQDKEYIVTQYAKFKNQYHHIITSKYQKLIPLIYAMMIYENYNKPEMIRKLEHLQYKFFQKSNQFGIMQIYSHQEITDEQSIKIALRKLEKIYEKKIKEKPNSKELLTKVLTTYYKRPMRQILEIQKIINEFNQK